MNQFFVLCRFYFRLYVYPYKVLYPSGSYAIRMFPHAPFYYFFNGLLLFLFAMNVWWFHFIILLIYRVATGQSNEVEDTREVGTVEVGLMRDQILTHQCETDICITNKAFICKH